MDEKGSVDYKALVRLCMKRKKKNRVLNQEQLDDLRFSLQQQCDGKEINENEWPSAIRWLTKKRIIRVEPIPTITKISRAWMDIRDQYVMTKTIFKCCPSREGFC